MNRTLSAPSTPFLKFVLAPGWILGFGYGTYDLWMRPSEVVFNGVKGAATSGDQWVFLVAFFAGASLMLFTCIPLKRVILTPTGLRVSNYFTDISVGLSAIEDVRQHRWLGGRAITLALRSSTDLGDTIRFLPATRSRLAFWRDDELVDELRHLAGLPTSAHARDAA